MACASVEFTAKKTLAIVVAGIARVETIRRYVPVSVDHAVTKVAHMANTQDATVA
jgi:hypothetical protein